MKNWTREQLASTKAGAKQLAQERAYAREWNQIGERLKANAEHAFGKLSGAGAHAALDGGMHKEVIKVQTSTGGQSTAPVHPLIGRTGTALMSDGWKHAVTIERVIDASLVSVTYVQDGKVIHGAALGLQHIALDDPPSGPVAQSHCAIPRTRGRTNLSNDGRAFQDRVLAVAQEYERQGLLMLRPCTPPARIVGSGPRRKVIFLPSPWLDFCGAWTERGGRMVVIEAKSCAKPNLPFGEGGLREKQREAMCDWYNARAIVVLLWERSGEVRIADWHSADTLSGVMKGLPWEHAVPIPAGQGRITFDFLSVMREWWK